VRTAWAWQGLWDPRANGNTGQVNLDEIEKTFSSAAFLRLFQDSVTALVRATADRRRPHITKPAGGKKKKYRMTPQKLLTDHLIPSSLLRRGWVLILLAVGSFAFSPQLRAQCDSPDPGCPGGNLAEGFLSLGGLTAGFYNTGIGAYSLLSLTDASFDTAVGAGALFSDNAGTNTAIGAGALFSNTTGSDNNAVGAFALFTNDSGTFNNAHGRNALIANVDGSENNAFGDLALSSDTSGGTNTGIGDDALFSVTTGNSNTALGDEAGSNLVDGEGNIYIGAQVQAGTTDEVEFIRIGNDTAFAFPYDTFIAGIFDRAVDVGTAVPVFVDDTGKLGTILVDAVGNKVATPQAMLNESRNQQKRIADLEGTVERLAAMVKEQAAQIQKVSAQLEVNKPAPQVVASRP
jgi:hypothetical protein